MANPNSPKSQISPIISLTFILCSLLSRYETLPFNFFPVVYFRVYFDYYVRMKLFYPFAFTYFVLVSFTVTLFFHVLYYFVWFFNKLPLHKKKNSQVKKSRNCWSWTCNPSRVEPRILHMCVSKTKRNYSALVLISFMIIFFLINYIICQIYFWVSHYAKHSILHLWSSLLL